MRMSPKARMNRLFTDGRCLDVAIDHGVCNEPSFMAGLEDIGGVVDQLIAARMSVKTAKPKPRCG